MSTAGLAKPRLDLMHRVLSGYMERGDMPGLVALVNCHDDVHVETLGTLAVGDTTPMARDTIFRIASLTKPVAAVAAMILIEDCRIRLDDPIDPWIPELANRRVLKSISSHLDDTVPAKRAITVRDLLTYRMGFGSVMAAPETYPIQKLIRDLRIGCDGPPLPSRAFATDEWLRNLGSLPLLAQPGERWMYQVSADVLGVLIARVSGMSLGEFMRERIFEPLGMTDTAFHVGADDLRRFATSYAFNRQTKTLDIYDDAADSAWAPQPPFESGGGGLVSTMDDYLAFCRMMLHAGQHAGGRILSRAAVEFMTSDQLSSDNRVGAHLFFGGFSSWGLGMAVDIGREEIYHSPGRFGWTGGLGTTAYTDPANRLIGILFTQRMMDSPEPPPVFTDFWTLAYTAMG
ncbi:MAG TPA: serine hydrolase domain-containing protein [Gemmatimonadaceae bacterium]|nr:serine hydrolase domain-containing protein [Gemmatimonadaceae bacterium]